MQTNLNEEQMYQNGKIKEAFALKVLRGSFLVDNNFTLRPDFLVVFNGKPCFFEFKCKSSVFSHTGMEYRQFVRYKYYMDYFNIDCLMMHLHLETGVCYWTFLSGLPVKEGFGNGCKFFNGGKTIAWDTNRYFKMFEGEFGDEVNGGMFDG